MAISSTFPMLILISTMFMSATPLSIGQKVTDNDMKHLCSKTSNPGVCYKLLKSDHRTTNVDAKGLVEVSVDLASKNADKIHSQFSNFAKATHDSKLRNIYTLCSKNYNEAIRDLQVVKHKLKSGADKNLFVQVKDASEEIMNCEKLFGRVSNDRGHIKKENKKFEFLLNIVKVMFDNLHKK